MVQDGEEAMAFLHRYGRYVNAPRPDLVLLDFNLPKKDGREVLAEMKADPQHKSIPVVVVSSSTSEEDVLRAYAHQASCFVAKPLDLCALTEVMGLVHQFWFEVASLPESIPATRPASKPFSAPPESPQAASATEEIRILLLEDNSTDAFLLRSALETSTTMKFQVEHVERLEDCIRKLASIRYDLVLTDLGVPDSQDFETFCRVRDAAIGTPVVVLTGIDSEETGVAALQEGAQDYLVKGQIGDRSLTRVIRHAMERHRLQDQLRQAQRMEVVGRLSGGIAHDFNNILSVIMGQAGLLKLERAEDPMIHERADQLLEASERAANLTRQLLTFCRQKPVQAKPVELNEIIGQMHRILSRVIGEQVALELRLCSESTAVMADIGMMEQILMNLAVNARDAMPNGGKLTIRSSCVQINSLQARKFKDAKAGDFVCLTVSDTGTGIPASVLPRIFDPFFTTKDVGRGTGLGLSTIYGIVQQHKGWINVTSAEGNGSTFEIHLPLMKSPVVKTEPKAKTQTLPQGTETILVVEDESNLRDLIARILTRQGFRPLVAANGPEALVLWSTEREKISLILTDMIMPEGMRGDELVARLRKDQPDVKVIYTSGYFEGNILGLNPKISSADFLAKPYTTQELLEAIRRQLDA